MITIHVQIPDGTRIDGVVVGLNFDEDGQVVADVRIPAPEPA